MSLGLIIAGIVILAVGIILGHFFPNRYWIVLVAMGIVVAVVGAILLIMASIGVHAMPVLLA